MNLKEIKEQRLIKIREDNLSRMNQERLKIFQDIVGDNSNQRFRDSFFKNRYNNIYNEIINFTDFDLPFPQKTWYWLNDIREQIFCNCGNTLTFNKNWIDGYRKGCSPKCTQQNPLTKELRKETNLLIYGVDNIAKNPDIIEKIKQTNLRERGVVSTFQDPEVREKFTINYRKNHGVDHPFQDPEVKEKIKQTCIIRYNNTTYGGSKDNSDRIKMFYKNIQKDELDKILDKREKTCLEKYGKTSYLHSNNYNNKMIEFFNQMTDEDIKNYYKNKRDKSIITCLEKYGVEHFSKTDEWKEYAEKYSVHNMINSYLVKRDEFLNSNNLVILNDNLFLGIKCKHEFESNIYDIRKRIKHNINPCIICNPKKEGSISQMELCSWIESLGINIIKNDREFLGNGKEIDIILNDYKLCLEFNGLYWHSDKKVDKNYHINKTNIVNIKGYELIHIWEDSWDYSKDIVKSMLLDRFNLLNDYIDINDCYIDYVMDDNKNNFLEDNYIEGYVYSEINIGLYYDKELVSLICFKYIDDNNFELVCLCNKINIRIDSYELLFKYFIDNFEFNNIFMYVDISISNSNINCDKNITIC